MYNVWINKRILKYPFQLLPVRPLVHHWLVRLTGWLSSQSEPITRDAWIERLSLLEVGDQAALYIKMTLNIYQINLSYDIIKFNCCGPQCATAFSLPAAPERLDKCYLERLIKMH